MTRILPFLLALLLLLPACAGADDYKNPILQPLPELTDPFDLYMRDLAIISQQEKAVYLFPYRGSCLNNCGCGPVCVANGIIASLGVTNREDAYQIVFETTKLMVPDGMYKRDHISINLIDRLMDKAQREATKERHPALGKYIAGFPGSIAAGNDKLDGNVISDLLHSGQMPDVLVGRAYVQDSWYEIARIMYALYEAGYEDATLCLSYAGAGKSDSDAPLRSGANGHYVSLLLHAGTLYRTGALYVLDSLPRALEGEFFSRDFEYHVQYRFMEDGPENAFNRVYAPSRISATVIKLGLGEAAHSALTAASAQSYATKGEKRDALIALHTQHLDPIELTGRCVVTIALNRDGLPQHTP